MSNLVSSYSAPNGAISKAIFPWTRWEPATRHCGTRSSASRADARRPKNSPSIAVRRGGYIVSTEGGHREIPRAADCRRAEPRSATGAAAGADAATARGISGLDIREPARRRPPLFRDPRRGAAYRCGVVGHAGAAAPGMHGLPPPTRISRQYRHETSLKSKPPPNAPEWSFAPSAGFYWAAPSQAGLMLGFSGFPPSDRTCCCAFGESCDRRASGHLAAGTHGPGQDCQMSSYLTHR